MMTKRVVDTGELGLRAEMATVMETHEHDTPRQLLAWADDWRLRGGQFLVEGAALALLCERAGVDLSERLKPGQLRLLRGIAVGTLDAQVVDAYMGTQIEPQLWYMPPGQQRRLADKGTVTVCDFDNGKVSKREVDPLKLTPLERQQVFGEHGLRDAAGQRSWLETQKKRPALKPRRVKGPVLVDRVHHQILVQVGGEEVAITADELIEYFKQVQ